MLHPYHNQYQSETNYYLHATYIYATLHQAYHQEWTTKSSSQNYTHPYSSWNLTSYIGLIWCSTTEATASWVPVEDTLTVRSSYCMYCTAVYPQSTLDSAPICSSLRGTASYETYVAAQRKVDVLFVQENDVNSQGSELSEIMWKLERKYWSAHFSWKKQTNKTKKKQCLWFILLCHN